MFSRDFGIPAGIRHEMLMLPMLILCLCWCKAYVDFMPILICNSLWLWLIVDLRLDDIKISSVFWEAQQNQGGEHEDRILMTKSKISPNKTSTTLCKIIHTHSPSSLLTILSKSTDQIVHYIQNIWSPFTDGGNATSVSNIIVRREFTKTTWYVIRSVLYSCFSCH